MRPSQAPFQWRAAAGDTLPPCRLSCQLRRLHGFCQQVATRPQERKEGLCERPWLRITQRWVCLDVGFQAQITSPQILFLTEENRRNQVGRAPLGSPSQVLRDCRPARGQLRAPILGE